MATTLIPIGAGFLARHSSRAGVVQWQPIWPDDRARGCYCSDASDDAGGGRIVHICPKVVADDDRAAIYSTRQRGLNVLSEHGVDVPMGAPRRDPTAARILLPLRVHPTTSRLIREAAAASGESAGQVVDRLARDGLGEQQK